jgi:hypothetical protein
MKILRRKKMKMKDQRIRKGKFDRSYSYVDTETDHAYVRQGMSREEYLEGIKERDRLEIARINQPIDIEWLKSQGTIVEVPDEKIGKTTECGAFDNSIVKQDIEQTKSVDDKDESGY